MKIAMPLDENKQEVCVSFGRAPYFYLYDTDTKKTQVVVNEGAEAQGGAGPKAAQIVLDNQADVLITVRLGENAAEVLQASNVKIYKAAQKSVEENRSLYEENKLELLDHFHKGFHGIA